MSHPTKPDLSISGQDFITLCRDCAADGRTIAGVTVKGTARYLPVVWERRPKAFLFDMQHYATATGFRIAVVDV